MRFLRPEFFTDEKVSDLPFGACFLFEGIWCQSDLRGVFEYSPRVLRGLIFPMRDGIDTATVQEWLNKLESAGMVARFEADGKAWGAVRNWLKHQTISPKEVETWSRRPAPPGWIDPPSWAGFISKALKDGRLRNDPRTFQTCSGNFTLTPSLTPTPTVVVAQEQPTTPPPPVIQSEGPKDGAILDRLAVAGAQGLRGDAHLWILSVENHGLEAVCRALGEAIASGSAGWHRDVAPRLVASAKRKEDRARKAAEKPAAPDPEALARKRAQIAALVPEARAALAWIEAHPEAVDRATDPDRVRLWTGHLRAAIERHPTDPDRSPTLILMTLRGMIPDLPPPAAKANQ